MICDTPLALLYTLYTPYIRRTALYATVYTRDWFAPTGTRSYWNSLLDCEKTLRATPTQQAC